MYKEIDFSKYSEADVSSLLSLHLSLYPPVERSVRKSMENSVSIVIWSPAYDYMRESVRVPVWESLNTILMNSVGRSSTIWDTLAHAQAMSRFGLL